MCSEAKITANRLNAKKSTGPRTLEGKVIVAQNGIKHGLLARQDLISGEDPQEFALCRDELLAELAPVGRMEAILAERIVSLAWRLKRAQRLQNQLFDYLLGKDLDLMLDGFLDRVTPNERRIESSLYRTMAELRRQQSARSQGVAANAECEMRNQTPPSRCAKQSQPAAGTGDCGLGISDCGLTGRRKPASCANKAKWAGPGPFVACPQGRLM
jgi:hypothetical protein